jgi:hypothetical protein
MKTTENARNIAQYFLWFVLGAPAAMAYFLPVQYWGKVMLVQLVFSSIFAAVYGLRRLQAESARADSYEEKAYRREAIIINGGAVAAGQEPIKIWQPTATTDGQHLAYEVNKVDTNGLRAAAGQMTSAELKEAAKQLKHPEEKGLLLSLLNLAKSKARKESKTQKVNLSPTLS